MSGTQREVPLELTGEGVVVRTTRPADAPELRRIRLEPEISRWWDELEEDFPMDLDADLTRLTILAGDEIVGMVQFSEEADPKYRSASLDIFISPSRQRRGFASKALRLVTAYLTTGQGHHRLVIDPAADNEAAIACYAKLGFRPVGRMQRSERDSGGGGWHDQLLMELVVPHSPAT
jgi:RimJ/RimL family protein N-acetyltransferase